MEVIVVFVVIFVIAYIWVFITDITTKLNERIKLKEERDRLQLNLSDRNKELREVNLQNKKYQDLLDGTIHDMKNNSVLLPGLARWADKLKEYEDEKIVNYLRTKKRPALKASDEVKIAKRKAREYKQEVELARNRVELYEALSPWLIEHTDISLEDMLYSLREEKKSQEVDNEKEDPVSLYVPKSEWHKLSVSERNQLALERYVSYRKKSLWQIGVAYERFVGYEFEKKGNKVNYHGATEGKSDLGIDLICENEKIVYVVQCKRLSRVKGIPVRENVVAQIYGATQLYKMKNKITKNVIPVLVTSYELSDEAKSFAEYLDVQVLSNYELSEYPMIKCNISNTTGEKIYHLPMDQQYDKVIIGDVGGEFYANTVAEAESKGFRRAYRWTGNNT